MHLRCEVTELVGYLCSVSFLNYCGTCVVVGSVSRGLFLYCEIPQLVRYLYGVSWSGQGRDIRNMGRTSVLRYLGVGLLPPLSWWKDFSSNHLLPTGHQLRR